MHLLGEVEVVFGFWAFVLVASMALLSGGQQAIADLWGVKKNPTVLRWLATARRRGRNPT